MLGSGRIHRHWLPGGRPESSGIWLELVLAVSRALRPVLELPEAFPATPGATGSHRGRLGGVGSTKSVVWRLPGAVGSTKIIVWRLSGAVGSRKIMVCGLTGPVGTRITPAKHLNSEGISEAVVDTGVDSAMALEWTLEGTLE